MFVNAQLRFAFTALDSQRLYWRLICLVLAIKVITEVPLIYFWGIYGASLGHLIGELALCVGSLIVLGILGVRGPHWSQLLRLLPAAAAMLIVLAPIWNAGSSLVAAAIYSLLSLAVYCFVCILTGALPWSDVRQIWQVLVNRMGNRGRTIGEATSPASREFTPELRVEHR
jgi:O-antigen/teichoic acid export membrane protein